MKRLGHNLLSVDDCLFCLQSRLEQNLDEALNKGDIEEAEQLSDRLATREVSAEGDETYGGEGEGVGVWSVPPPVSRRQCHRAQATFL